MFEITVRTSFSAAHALRLPDGRLEPMHGHDWHLSVTVAAERLDRMGAVMDFHALQDRVESVVAPWRNRNLNGIEPFAAGVASGDDGSHGCGTPGRAWNPTAERVCEVVAGAVGPALPEGVRLREVAVTEAIGCLARYLPGG